MKARVLVLGGSGPGSDGLLAQCNTRRVLSTARIRADCRALASGEHLQHSGCSGASAQMCTTRAKLRERSKVRKLLFCAPSNEAWAALPTEILGSGEQRGCELLNALHYHMVNPPP
ncbi:transforming growth factor-beta-induced protein ig-h3 [Lates japonicus]|uniref:Transforming growth factor-beta-induced protein ig-h3 n=1 Tax=Lates japonicus TaxID=270547 RepID=A0AAD3NAL6_LATJO|nr:transforming growth factor-beta-induced protein ig-h3 [Lates japonicus]